MPVLERETVRMLDDIIRLYWRRRSQRREHGGTQSNGCAAGWTRGAATAPSHRDGAIAQSSQCFRGEADGHNHLVAVGSLRQHVAIAVQLGEQTAVG